MESLVLIFAILNGRPAVLEYHGRYDAPIDPLVSRQITFKEAKRRIEKYDPPILFAPPNYAVVRVTEKDALALIEHWKPYIGKRVGSKLTADFRKRTKAIMRRKQRK